MYRTENGLRVYETLDELPFDEIVSASEYQGFYYIELKPEFFYEEDVWVVDKKTGKVSRIDTVTYICKIEKKAKKIDPAILRRGA